MAVLVVPPMFVLQRSVLTKQLEIAATTDAKTGLLNAATWHHVAGVELVRAEREGYGAAVLIIDMDNFKLINDSYGHLVGDDVLKAVADCDGRGDCAGTTRSAASAVRSSWPCCPRWTSWRR